jgi:hypothetical protein
MVEIPTLVKRFLCFAYQLSKTNYYKPYTKHIYPCIHLLRRKYAQLRAFIGNKLKGISSKNFKIKSQANFEKKKMENELKTGKKMC